MTRNELYDMLQLHTIRRWQIVEVSRDQSVAEHSFRVWALTMNLYDTLFTNGSLERESLSQLALIHDLPEIVTGDIPSTMKDTLNKIGPEVSRRLEEIVTQEGFPTVYRAIKGMVGTPSWYLLKIADNVEAILWMQQYGIYKAGARGCSEDVVNGLMRKIEDILHLIKMKYPSTADWSLARDWVETVIGGLLPTAVRWPDVPPAQPEGPSQEGKLRG